MPETYQTLSQQTAELIRDLVQTKPNACLGLPTGRTPMEFYRLLSQWSQQGKIDWAQTSCFQLDEYFDTNPEHSYRNYLILNLYRNTNLSPDRLYNPMITDDYDALITAKGGLDLTVLGLGRNGHIAFNEPGTPLNTWTHSLWLAESTRKANAEFFDDGCRVPTRAVSMGLQTILSSRRLILIVSGEEKREILQKALRGEITSSLPASFLQLHKDLLVLTDFDY
ncbi:MAG: glucosamine-6-phosphate deaminase [Candidatus Obscuribacterales bacterium]|nr:glucosamine-6-phosphate deaminase [Candidatus Obscuribacterales bacterium]